jgi:hypothetical protein
MINVFQGQPETVGDMEFAADQRYLEGLELMIQGRLWAGVYLMGYSAEISLKTACFFHLPQVTAASSVAALRWQCKNQFESAYPTINYNSGHGVNWWSRVLCDLRYAESQKLQSARLDFGSLFKQEIQFRSDRLYNNWWVEMRYRNSAVSNSDLYDVFDDVSWLRTNYLLLKN